ncbi:MAG: bifunctional adenosylcobinamide kinase/adenosylcobinamide-phosphate guanylyltransferase [Nitrospirae bacterium GWC2_42_7]|nr:MAG: bifunctional adenosylcobinamide kinase/adenosylcobinamide-phosphate guanylyltransferase [Nitrospirae bacterium GWC2_42_7]
MNKKIIFITGGTRSGKSSFALQKAMKLQGKRAYIATAEALDEEMEERIKKHKKDRGNDWDTYEEPLKIPGVLKKIESQYAVIVLDCLTLWLSNLLHSNKNAEEEIESFCNSLSTIHGSLFIVSNEVGMGIVPENELARKFRDLAGIINQKVARASDEVFMVVAGIPVKIKG